MKKATYRKSQTTPRHRFDEDDELVLADLRALRDDDALIMAPLTTEVGDKEAALDRLLAHHVSVEPVMETDLTPSNVPVVDNRFNALDDFEPDFSTAFMVEAIDDSHQILPRVEVLDIAEAVCEPALSVNPSQADFDESEATPLQIDNKREGEAAHEKAAEPTNEYEPPSAFFTGAVDDAAAVEIEIRCAPVIEPPTAVLTEASVQPAELTSERRVQSVEFRTEDKPEIKPARADGTPIMEASHLATKTERFVRHELSGEPPYHCAYKAEQARINLLSLILGIGATLAAILLYLMLQDTRHDLAKLNELVDIMKDDIQMGHDEMRGE